MNFYSSLNQFIDEIEANLDSDLRLSELAKKNHLSLSMVERIFPLLTGMSLSEYIRKRRLTLAGRDLAQGNWRVIDVAMKYGYDSSAAFSRTFKKFHGLKPSEVKTHASALKYCQKLVFKSPDQVQDVKYEIVELPTLELYGISIETDVNNISHDAPQLFIDTEVNHPELPHPNYGLVDCCDGYDPDFKFRYWVLWQNQYPELQSHQIPASRWLKFRVNSQNAGEIQSMSHWFWDNFLPTCCYELKAFPELEHYHDGVTDFFVPIK